MIGAFLAAVGLNTLRGWLLALAAVAATLGLAWGIAALRDHAVLNERLRQRQINDEQRDKADAAEDAAKGCAGDWDRQRGRCLPDAGHR